jgi:hypothetical protein
MSVGDAPTTYGDREKSVKIVGRGIPSLGTPGIFSKKALFV